MSINLLVEANNLRKSQRSNNSSFKRIAKKGRTFSSGGKTAKDTKLRNVLGELSHVNDHESAVIDVLGPLGQAWVASIGSGTINPKTGLREYGLFNSNPFKSGGALNPGGTIGSVMNYGATRSLSGFGDTWRPSQGKWGFFGQTANSKMMDLLMGTEKKRKKQFDKWIDENKDENVAGMYQSGSGAADVEQWITAGTAEDATDASTMKKSEFDRVINKYDPRKEGNIQDAFASKSRGAGTEVAGASFGLLTEASQLGGQQGFSGAGNFAQDMQQEQIMDTAKEDNMAMGLDKASEIADVQEDFNDEFWGQLTSWNTAKTA